MQLLPILLSIPLIAALPTPPGIPSAATAESELASLTVAPQGSEDGYSRELFPHWINQGNHCNTRDMVLARDGQDVVQDDDCYPTSGTWYSPYDGTTWTEAKKLDIDHFVPLANAWRSGASEWSTAQRTAFANDLTHPQLVAVSEKANRSKGDKGPEEWKPPLASFHCTYARMWVSVKSTYALTITSEEKEALVSMLDTC
ncbi:HNH endonuclease family protein [Aspergillus clavatus NRRL 1]|uniref:GmrSD restriction endonucleases C-terminal domain-containing protein n=1 Tax=Aspergillus clavatus (strain ATCC 1007 / CBS 513.65 / DSM 816 / NCTC 3887 / NRRL 1 / QM 1276 / 107) TaxID=344612 RepID=A1C5K2_ASPCL|nr:uncharacterized protein ACLA_003830 [Aspergillus clavatus NRRL 1]EAW14970.1 conserved hypothetical protein [Aspergillus clavatus NRRL 1]